MQPVFQKNEAAAASPIEENTPKEVLEALSGKTHSEPISTLIIGLIAQDTICTITGDVVMQDSNPGLITSSVGGVGFNVALANHYSLNSKNLTNKSRLVSALGDDIAGAGILTLLKDYGIDHNGVKTLSGCKTAQYVASIDSNGHLLLASADMRIIESPQCVDHIVSEIGKSQPKLIIVDCNLLKNGLDAVLEAASSLPITPRIIVEPTSAPKLSRLVEVNTSRLKVYPQNLILMITPTAEELAVIHSSFGKREFFDDYDSWFPLLDLMGIDSLFREKMVSLAGKNEAMKHMLEKGIVQQAVQILPYIPKILVKLGSRGCVLFSLNTNVNDYKSVPTTSPFKPTFTLISKGRNYEEGKTLGITIEYFAVPPENANLSVVDVTGAGDTLLGCLVALLAQNDWLTDGVELLEQEWGKWEGIYKSQVASGLTIESSQAVSEAIRTMK